MSHFPDLPVHSGPNLPLFHHPVHALLNTGEQVHLLGVVHGASKEVRAICRIDHPCSNRTTPQLYCLLHVLLLELPHQWWKATTGRLHNSVCKTLCRVQCREQLPGVEKVVHKNSGPNVWKTKNKPDDMLGCGQ